MTQADDELGTSVHDRTDEGVAEETIGVLFRRVLPFLVLCYFVAFLDRVNIGFAASHMSAEIGLTATAFGFGAGIFALGYIVFEVPSNLALHRFGARIWIPRIMITWGLVSAGFAFAQGPWSFAFLRFLLGVAEAGFFPGIVFYLSTWFPRRALARATAILILGLPVSVLVGAPLSAGLISWLHSVLGLSGWQWMFLVEGGIAVLTGIAAIFVLTDGPEGASWLTPRQRSWLLRTLAAERRAKEAVRRFGVLDTLRNPRVLLLSLCLFLNVTALYAITLWMPQIIEGFGELTAVEANLLTAVPYLCTGVAMVLVSRHSDRSGELRFHLMIPAVVGGMGLALAGATSSPVVALVGLCIGAAGVLSSNVLFWGLPSMFLTGAAAATGIAMVNSIGNVGGFVGPYLTGWARDAFGSYTAGMYVLGGLAVLYGLFAFANITYQQRARR